MRRAAQNQALVGVAATLFGIFVADARADGSGAASASSEHAAAVAGASVSAAPVPAPPSPLDSSRARDALAAIPVLASLAERFSPFNDSDVDAALRRGERSRQSIQVWTMMPSAFAWNPVPEKTLWVVSGRVGGRVLLAVIDARRDGTFAHAGSALIDEPDATLAIGASAEYPKQLIWSTCYGCAGEGGTIRFTDDGRVEFTYR